MEKLLDVNEASKFLELSPKTIYAYVCQKKIPYVKIRSSVRFRPSDLEAWVEKHYVQPISEE